MNIGDLLDGAFSLYRRNFVTLVGIVAVATLPVLLLEVVASVLLLPADPFFLRGGVRSLPDLTPLQTGSLLGGGLLFVVAGLLGALAGIFETGALATFISESYLGRQLDIRSAYARALRRWPALLGMSLFLLLIYGMLFAVVIVPVGLSILLGVVGRSGDILGVLAICLACGILPVLLVVFYVLGLRWQFAPQAIVVENCGTLDGLRRSWNLITGSFWRVAGINLVLGILIWIISSVVSFSLQFAGALLPSFVLVNLLSTVVTSALQMAVLPIQLATLTLLYYDLRVRKEGFDLEMMAQQLAPAAGAQPA
jgi:hypothetical protein